MHIYKLPSGKWRAQGSTNGKKWSLSRPTKAEARHAGAEQEVRLGADTSKASSAQLTVGEIIAGHLASVDGKWSPTTHDDLRRIESKLPQAFLDRRVRKIQPSTLHALYEQLADDGWSAHRIKKAHTLISVSLKSAVIHGHIVNNPCREVSPPTPDTAAVVAPEHAEVKAILAASDPRLYLFLRMAAATGARRGEVVALQWGDIDFELGTVSITRSLAQKEGGPVVERGTKTGVKGHRKLQLDATTLDALRDHQADAAKKAADRKLGAPVWMFSNDGGQSPWRPDRATRLFGVARAKAGVPHVKLKNVRHYVATTMLQDGEEAIDVAGQLGHSTVATTLSVYASYMPGRGREAAERRAARLD